MACGEQFFCCDSDKEGPKPVTWRRIAAAPRSRSATLDTQKQAAHLLAGSSGDRVHVNAYLPDGRQLLLQAVLPHGEMLPDFLI
jgi:hypothetical protein